MLELPNSCASKHFTIKEGDFTIKCGLTPREYQSIYKLRSQVFCKELQWVGNPTDTYEYDEFDTSVNHIGVFLDGEAVGTLRIHEHDHEWMILSTFKQLIPSQTTLLKNHACAEVSRLAVSTKHRHLDDGKNIAQCLYKGLFSFCMINNIRLNYMVISLPVLRVLRLGGLPCEKIGDPMVMDKRGTTAVAGLLDWAKFTSKHAADNPQKLDDYFQALANAQTSSIDVSQDSKVIGI